MLLKMHFQFQVDFFLEKKNKKGLFNFLDVLNPLIHQIDPENTSVDELVLERRILEDKILELRQEKLTM